MHIKHDKFVWEGKFVRNGDVDKYVDEMVEIGYARMEDVLRLQLGEFGIKNSLVLEELMVLHFTLQEILHIICINVTKEILF